MPKAGLGLSPSIDALAIEGGSLSSFPVSIPGSTGTGTVTELSDGSVTTAKLANAAVTADKLATGAVTTDKIANAAIPGAKVASGQVVKSINSLKDDVTLTAGTNVTITPSSNTLIITATGQPGPAGPTGPPGGSVIFEFTGQAASWTVPDPGHAGNRARH